MGLIDTHSTLVLNHWDWEKNQSEGLSPYTLTYGSTKRSYWVCGLGHSWQAITQSVTSGHGCPVCAGKVALIGFNDITTTTPEILPLWDYESNNLRGVHPTSTTSRSSIEVSWGCRQRHKWIAPVYSVTRGTRCPYCAGKRVIPGITDILTTHPEVEKYLHPTKNTGIDLSNVSPYGRQRLWMYCGKHEWSVQAYHFTKSGSRCPKCTHRVSRTEMRFADRVRELDGIDYVETNHREGLGVYEVDIYIPTIKLGIEFNGVYYHSEKFREYGAHQKKAIKLISSGIHLMVVWEDDWDRDPERVLGRIQRLVSSGIPTPESNVVSLEDPWDLSRHKISGYLPPEPWGMDGNNRVEYQGGLTPVWGYGSMILTADERTEDGTRCGDPDTGRSKYRRCTGYEDLAGRAQGHSRPGH